MKVCLCAASQLKYTLASLKKAQFDYVNGNHLFLSDAELRHVAQALDCICSEVIYSSTTLHHASVSSVSDVFR